MLQSLFLFKALTPRHAERKLRAMDVGLVCDQCDAFNAMAAASCIVCGTGLSLGARRPASYGQAPAVGSPQTGVPVPNLGDRPQAKGSPHSSRVCAHCGTAIQPGFRFCGSCGVPVAATPPRQVERRTQYFSAMQQQARAKLVLIKGDGLDGISFMEKARAAAPGAVFVVMTAFGTISSAVDSPAWYRSVISRRLSVARSATCCRLSTAAFAPNASLYIE